MPDLFDKKLVFVTGKGGVGKSTISIALGMAAAARGKRTIVCEISSQENASRLFGKGEIGFNEVELDKNLWAISIDPDESIREYLLLQLKVRAMRDLLVRSRIFNYLAAATPGLKELVTIGKIWELAQHDRKVKKGREYDLVVVDAPATGHGIGFLQTPRTFAGIARMGPIHSQAKELDRYITDHRTTGVAIVSIPEEMPVNESASLEETLTGEIGVAVDRVYMNAMYPERFDGSDARELERALDRSARPRPRRDQRRPQPTPPRQHPARPAQAPEAPCLLAGQDPPLHLQTPARGLRARAPCGSSVGPPDAERR